MLMLTPGLKDLMRMAFFGAAYSHTQQGHEYNEWHSERRRARQSQRDRERGRERERERDRARKKRTRRD